MMHKLIEYFRDRPAIRERDASGKLTAAGFEWSEPVEVIALPLAVLAVGLLFYAGAVAHDARAPSGASVLFVIAAIVCAALGYFLGSTDRGIAFTHDGKVSIRGGWINGLEMLFTIAEHADIASIEMTTTHRGHAVVILTTWGGTYVLSNGLDEPHARLVAVQLTIALRQIRESIADVRNFQRHRADTRSAWID